MINIVCFGDSITEGSEFPVAVRWGSLLQKKLDDHRDAAALAKRLTNG